MTRKLTKTERKGVGDYPVTVRGRSAHAGVDFQAGASAILELARANRSSPPSLIWARGITVNPGVITGGTRTNVIADSPVEVDIRVSRANDAAVLERKFGALSRSTNAVRLIDGRTQPAAHGETAARALFRRRVRSQAKSASTWRNRRRAEDRTATSPPRWDSDARWAGEVGEGAHSPGESILVERIADRTALLSKLVAAL